MDRENIRIDTFVKTGFIEYIEKIDRYKHSKLKNTIINVTNSDPYEKGEKSYDDDLDYAGIRNGSVVMVEDKFYLDIFKQNLMIKYGMIEDLDFHISQSDDIIPQPVFMLTNKVRLNDSMADKLDNV